MNLHRQFLSFISAEKLFEKKHRLLIAVSGGLDSVVLADLCSSCGFQFEFAHCNFQLRGEESERDEAFVSALAGKYAVDIYVKRFDTLSFSEENKLSVQLAARHLRYTWFNELVGGDWQSPSSKSVVGNPAEKVADFLLTAHHADDNIETSVMNFFKGTGISGLRGILPKQGRICRPLLFTRKSELLNYAEDYKLSWVEDSSNTSEKYSRNKFRNSVLPMVEEIYPAAADNLLINIDRFRDIEILYRQRLNAIISKLLTVSGTEIKIPVLVLRQLPPKASICYEIIKNYNFSAAQTVDVLGLLDAETGKYVESSTHRVIRHRNMLIIALKAGAETETHVIEDASGVVEVDKYRISFSVEPSGNENVSADPSTAFLDADKIVFPLIIRKRRQSDYFYPLGMHKKKKVSRFLSDKKLSLTDKEKVWLVEMDKKLLWVVGLRIDDRFKLTENSRRILKITVIDISSQSAQ